MGLKRQLAVIGAVGVVFGLMPVNTIAQSTRVDSVTPNSSAVPQIMQHLVNQDTTFTVNIGFSQAANAFKVALGQQSYFSHLIAFSSYSGTSSRTTFLIRWRQSKQQSAALDAMIKKVEAQILKPGDSDYDKEFAIHNWIVLHTAYDQSLQRYTPYEAMTQGKAVCEGYALLAYKMLTLAGIPNRLVDGYAGGQSHLWNKVYVGGHWYNLDVTWDDPIPDQPGRVQWNYYNLTDSQIARDHTWNQNGLPVANTDFAQTLAKLLPNTSDKGLNLIASETGILNELNSQLVTSKTLTQAVQQAIVERKASVTFKFHGTVNEAQSAINTLFASGLTGFRYIHSSVEPSRSSGYVLITFTITY